MAAMAAKPRGRLVRIDAFRLALGVGLVIALLHFADGLSLSASKELPLVSRIEHAAQDYALTHLSARRAPSGRVVIVAIDEKSIRAEGRWPWSHARMARLVDGLAKGGVRAVGFDVIWAEEDVPGRRMARLAAGLQQARAASDPVTARRLGALLETVSVDDPSLPPDADPTELLASAVERAGNVAVGFMVLSVGEARPQDLASRLQKLGFFRTEPVRVPRDGRLVPADDAGGAPRTAGASYPAVEAPLDTILAVADCGGYFNVFPDPDGTIRRYTLVASAGGVVFPALGVATLAKALGSQGVAAPVVPVGTDQGDRVQQVLVGKMAIDTDALGRVPLHYLGSYRDFPTWSATDVIHGRLPRAQMEGRIVLVGNTAVGTWDQRVTPFDEMAPGVITHATFVENVLAGDLLHRTELTFAAELALMLALAGGLALLFSRIAPALAAPALLLALGAWTAFALVALRRYGTLFAMGLPTVQIMAMFLAAMSLRFFTEEREKRKARETFSHFLAPSVVEEVLGRQEALRLGGEKRELTVLFSDIRGFTSISEQLDPHVLLGVLNEYLTPMTDIIVSENSGTLDKYIGDAIMAFWGAPKEQPDHPLLACRAALRMLEKLEELRPAWKAAGFPQIDIGIGINTGPMSVGFVGSQDRFYNYTVLGDAVNLASRLEGANKEYGTRILLSASTAARVREAMVVREVDTLRVKGKREPVVIYELMGAAPASEGQGAFLAEFNWALTAWKAQRWDEAVAHFKAADAIRRGDACSRVYLARCEDMRRHPPGPEWDGVYEMKSK